MAMHPSDAETRRARIALAEGHLCRADELIARQRARVADLTEHGHDPGGAQRLLAIMLDIRSAMQEHRDVLVSSAVAADAEQPSRDLVTIAAATARSRTLAPPRR